MTIHFPSRQKYISVIYSDKTQNRLRSWCLQNGFNLAMSYSGNLIDPHSFEFHTTIIMTSSKHFDVINQISKIPEIEVKPKGFLMLGKKLDVPVMLLHKDVLVKTREKLMEMYDMEDRWPSFVPHVSLSYDPASKDTVKIEELELPDFPLTIDKFKIEDDT